MPAYKFLRVEPWSLYSFLSTGGLHTCSCSCSCSRLGPCAGCARTHMSHTQSSIDCRIVYMDKMLYIICKPSVLQMKKFYILPVCPDTYYAFLRSIADFSVSWCQLILSGQVTAESVYRLVSPCRVHALVSPCNSFQLF